MTLTQAQLTHAHLGTRALSSQVLTIGASSVRSTQLAEGLYRVIATEACWIRQGSSTVAAADATAGSWYLAAGQPIDLVVDHTDRNGYIAAIGTSGTLNIGLRRT